MLGLAEMLRNCTFFVWIMFGWVESRREKRKGITDTKYCSLIQRSNLSTSRYESQQIKTTDCVPEFAGAEAAGSSESLRRPHSICLCGKPPLYSFFQPFAGTLWQPSRRLAKMWRWRQMDESAWALLHLWHTEGRYRIIHLRGWCGIQTGSDLLYLQMILPRWPS